MNSKILYPELSYKITGLLFKIHNDLGRYRNEKQYGDALENLLTDNGLEFKREALLPISFAGEHSARNKVDFLIEDKIILELKAKTTLTKEDYFQIKRYLVSLNNQLGILVNFRSKYLTPKRILNGNFSNK